MICFFLALSRSANTSRSEPSRTVNHVDYKGTTKELVVACSMVTLKNLPIRVRLNIEGLSRPSWCQTQGINLMLSAQTKWLQVLLCYHHLPILTLH